MANQEPLYQGNVLLHWVVDEYEQHHRGPLWYLIVVVLGLGMLVYALATQNFLFAIIVIMFGVIIGLSALREPQRLPFIVTDLGVAVGGKFFPYKEFDNFWILYEPPEVKNIYFEFRRSPRPHLVVPLYDENPLELRKILLDYIDENPDEEEEPLSDFFGRFLKL